ncbi:MAG: cytochrome b/b6 domain-containing protein [Pseudomonadota bacterium]
MSETTSSLVPASAPSLAYNSVARWLHWLVAALIVVQYLLAELGEDAGADDERLAQLALLANHKSVGMTVLALVLLRLLWRLFNRPPPLPDHMLPWQRLCSLAAHGSLYGLILFLPITGWLMSSATAYSVSWFNLFSFPDLIGPSEALAEAFKSLHDWAGQLLFVVAIVHVLAAFKHWLWDRDQVLQRMASVPSVATAGVLLGLSLWGLTPGSTDRRDSEETAVSDQPKLSDTAGLATDGARSVSEVLEGTTVQRWTIDRSRSFIRFTGEQAGAPFTGEWLDWDAAIAFDPERLDASAALVTVYTAAVDSGDDERDASIVGEDFFNAEVHPDATFAVHAFESIATGYAANGSLSIKGIELPLTLNFQLNGSVLTGSAVIDRLLFNVGTGDWSDTEWVGKDVEVSVQVVKSN